MSAQLSQEKVSFALETWKTAVGVQEHFNTIEMQIRNLAVTVLTATVAAAGIIHVQTQRTALDAVKAKSPIPDADVFRVFAVGLGAAQVILIGGLIAWGAFYFMDRWWYHRLLKGAVDQATVIERTLKDAGYGDLMGLTTSISKGSPFKLFGHEVHSTGKLDLFYLLVALLIVLLILVM